MNLTAPYYALQEATASGLHKFPPAHCVAGNLVFHKFSVIQLREDGGTHRVAVLTIALVAGNLFIFGCPIGSYVPKWFLGGLFMNTGWSFLKKTLLSYETLTTFNWRGVHLVSPQYGISSCCVLMALYFSPTTSILAGGGLR